MNNDTHPKRASFHEREHGMKLTELLAKQAAMDARIQGLEKILVVMQAEIRALLLWAGVSGNDGANVHVASSSQNAEIAGKVYIIVWKSISAFFTCARLLSHLYGPVIQVLSHAHLLEVQMTPVRVCCRQLHSG